MEMEKNIEISLLFDFYGQLLSDKQREAVALYYNDDLSLSETAGVMGITRQGVRDLIRRSGLQLFEYERKLGLYARFAAIGESAERIRRLAGNIERSGCSDAAEAAAQIIAEADKLEQQEGK